MADALRLNVYADPHGGNYAKPLLQKLFGLPMPTDSEWMEKGAKVLRIPDLDWHTTCIRLVSCLETVKKWLDANPQSVPISVLLKLEGFPGREIESVVEHKAQHSIGWNDEMLLRSLDEEIRSVFPNDQLIVPDNIRRNGFTLEESVLLYGWPTLDSARGRIYFLMDGSVPAVRDAYIYKRASLDGRVIFTNSKPGEPDCAFQSVSIHAPRQIAMANVHFKIDYLHTTFESEPHVRKMVRMGYLVRTSADRWLDEARSCYLKRREEAFKSGAHIIATDFEDHNMGQRLPCDYVVELPHNRTAVCNQVNAPRKCNDDKIEPPK